MSCWAEQPTVKDNSATPQSEDAYFTAWLASSINYKVAFHTRRIIVSDNEN